jgi:lambda family phage tail tape measure protein
MANRSLGTLTYNLVASIGGFTSGMDQAERAAADSAKKINDQIASIGVASYAVGNALGQYLKEGVDLAISAFPKLIDSVAQFQDIADKTGGSASGFAAFAVSAKTADVSIDSIVDASARLSKALLQAGDDTKPINAGLTALGINIAQFKQQSPDQQIATIANSFAGFADGANKAAVAQQIFGRSGADLIKFFKDYTDNGGGVTTLTDQMIQQADDFSDASKRASAEVELWAGALSVQALPALTALKETAVDAIKALLGMDDSTSKLGQNTGVADFADQAVKALAFVVDATQGVSRAFEAMGTVIAGAAATVKVGLDQGFKAALATAQDAHADVEAILQKPFFSATLNQNLAKAHADATKAVAPDTRPVLPATAPAKKGAADQAAQEAKAQLASDLAAIKALGAAQEDAIKNSEKLLDAYHSAGITGDTDYYAQRKALIDQDTAVQVDSLNQQIARMQAQTFTGKSAVKDQIDNQKKIGEAQAQITKIQADAVTQSKVLDIQEQSRLNKQAAGLLAARQAAEDYFDTVNKGYAQNLAAVGKGDKTNDFNASINSITNNFDQQRQNIQNQIAQAKVAGGGSVNTDLQKQFDAQLAIVDEFEAKQLASFKKNYADIQAAQSDWSNGAIKSLQNYADAASNTADLTKGVFDQAFSGLEDQLTTFLTTGKANWKDFANSIITDITRVVVKQQLLGPLAEWLGGSQKSGDTGVLGSLFGGGSGSSGGISGILGSLFGGSSKSASNDPLGDFISKLGGTGAAASTTAAATATASLATAATAAAEALTNLATSSATSSIGGAGGLGDLFSGGGGSDDVLGDFISSMGFASGGYTGAGAANDPAGFVHKGEVVWSQADIARAGGVGAVQAMRKGMGGSTQVVNFAVQGSIDRSTQTQVANKLRRETVAAGARMGG